MNMNLYEIFFKSIWMKQKTKTFFKKEQRMKTKPFWQKYHKNQHRT